MMLYVSELAISLDRLKNGDNFENKGVTLFSK